jgi:hypothetical protein
MSTTPGSFIANVNKVAQNVESVENYFEAMQSLEKFKGAWTILSAVTAEESYYHGGLIWHALQNSTGIEPGVTPGWSDYWISASAGQVAAVDSFENLAFYEAAGFTQVYLAELHPGIPESGGTFGYDETIDKSTADGNRVIDTTVSLSSQGSGVGTGCFIRQDYIVTVKQSGATGDGGTNDTSNFNDALLIDNKVKIIPEGEYLANYLTSYGKDFISFGILKQASQDSNMLNTYSLDKNIVDGVVLEVNKTLSGSGHATVDRDSKYSTMNRYIVTEMGGNGFGLVSYTNTFDENLANTYTDMKFIGDPLKKSSGIDSGGLLLANNKFCMSSNIFSSDLGQFGTYEIKGESAFNAACNIIGSAAENTVYFGTETASYQPNNIVSNVISHNADYSAVNLGQAHGNIISNVISYDTGSVSTQPHGAVFDDATYNIVTNLLLEGMNNGVPYPIRFRGNSNHNFVSVCSNVYGTDADLVYNQDTSYRNCVRIDMGNFSDIFAKAATLGDRSFYDGSSTSSCVYAPFTGQHIGTTTGGFTWMPSNITIPSLFSTDRFRMLSNGDSRLVVGASGETGVKFVSGIDSSLTYASIKVPENSGIRIDLGYTSDNSTVPNIRFNSTSVTPSNDNLVDLGAASTRFATVYAGTGTINTSDEREKTFYDIEQAEIDCAKALKGMMRKFKFNDAIALKGEENARIHYGVSAQSIASKMEEFGLDPMKYAFICYDEWEDEWEDVVIEEAEYGEDGGLVKEETKESRLVLEAGNRYGVRYEELLCFIMSAM